MGFWDVNDVNAARLNRLGPICDEVVGDSGNYQDLNAAVAAGARNIILMDGAFLSANLTIPSSGWLVHLGGHRHLNLGAYQLTLQGSHWRCQGFSIQNSTGHGIVIDNCGVDFYNVRVSGAATDGFRFQGSGVNDCSMINCWAFSNGSDGVIIASGFKAVRISALMGYGNGQYGVRDYNPASQGAIVTGSRLDGNTLGRLTGVWVDVGNSP